MANTNYKIVNGKPVGYFMFEEDQDDRTEDGEAYLQFYTGANGKNADDNPPQEVYDTLEEILAPHFPGILIGAAESMHMIDPCTPEEHGYTIEQIVEILTAAGWQEQE